MLEFLGIVAFVAYSYWDSIGDVFSGVIGIVTRHAGTAFSTYGEQVMPVLIALAIVSFVRMSHAAMEAERNRPPEIARVQHIFVKSFSRA